MGTDSIVIHHYRRGQGHECTKKVEDGESEAERLYLDEVVEKREVTESEATVASIIRIRESP